MEENYELLTFFEVVVV